MSFMHAFWLFGLSGLLVPIILHLQRRRTKVMDWAAIRFLQRSLTQHRRGLTLEQYLLLLCRCLLVATFVLAMARPWTNQPQSFGSVAAIGLGIAGLAVLVWGVVSPAPAPRRILTSSIGLALCLIASCLVSGADEALGKMSQTPRDVVLIVDGSDSMGLPAADSPVAGQRRFDQALEAAARFVDKLPPKSTVALLLADSSGRMGQARLNSNLALVRESLRTATFEGGVCQLQTAIERAQTILQRGQHAERQMVILSDTQRSQWLEPGERPTADHLTAQAMEPPLATNDPTDRQMSTVESSRPVPRLLGRFWKLPTEVVNMAVTKIDLDDSELRLGQMASVSVEVFNGGSKTVSGATLEILVDDLVIESQGLPPLEPGLRHVVTAKFVCPQVGVQVISGRVDTVDDLPSDNRLDRAVVVRGPIRVLILHGDARVGSTRRSAHYVHLALNNRSLESHLLATDSLPDDFEFGGFDSVILCDVPQLRDEIATALADHIAAGSGMLILLGSRCEAEFYNRWQWKQQPFLPAVLKRYCPLEAAQTEQSTVDLSSVRHPALAAWVASGQHDLLDWLPTRIWEYETSALVPTTPEGVTTTDARPPNPAANFHRSPTVQLNDGRPLLSELALGRGRVFVQTSAPDPRDNNFISRVGFPVWLHLLVRHLAQAAPSGVHQAPQTEWRVEIPSAAASTDSSPMERQLMLRNPAGQQVPVTALRSERHWTVDLGMGTRPGLYRLSGELETAWGSGPWPLTIGRPDQESDLSSLTEKQFAQLVAGLGLTELTDDTQWLQAATQTNARTEWWRTLAAATLGLLWLECLVLLWTRWRRMEDPTSAKIQGLLWRPATLGLLPFLATATYLGWSRGWSFTNAWVDAEFEHNVDVSTAWVASLSCLVAWTYGERANTARFPWSSGLMLARLMALGLLGYILAEPVHRRTEETEQRRQVVVLWDQSASMQLPEFERRRETVAHELLFDGYAGKPPLLEVLEQDYDVLVYPFAATARLALANDIPQVKRSALAIPPNATGENSTVPSAWKATTDLSAALQRVITDVPLPDLSGVIVLTDGCDRSQVAPITVVSPLTRLSVPLHSIIIGDQAPIVDAEVVALQTPSQVYMGDQITLRASLKFDQLRDQVATVRVFRDQDVIHTQQWNVSDNQWRTTLQVVDLPSQVGLHQYRVEIELMNGERVAANNQRSASVWVTNDRLRMLLIDHRPRWEFRYLKNLFAGRDRNVALQHVLIAPDRLANVPAPFPMPASSARAFDDCEANRLPATENDWLKFDVIVLGDVDPSELGPSTQRILDKFVRQRGGTLVVIAGPQAMPHRYFDQPLANLLPIQPRVQTHSPSSTGYRIQLTNEGRSSPLLHAANPKDEPGPTDSERSSAAEMWESLPPLHWRHSASIAKPGATVWAWADPGDARLPAEAARDHALLLWHRYGGGRVLQLNFDQTWRLRFWNGDTEHHRFWGRLLRWGTEDRLGIGTDLVRMGLDRTQFQAGDQLNVKVRWVDEEFAAPTETGTRLVLSRDDRPIAEFQLHEVPDSGGLRQSQITLPDLPGRYRIQVIGPIIERLLSSDPQGPQAIFADISVDGPTTDGEAHDMVASSAVAIPLAAQTGGLVLTPPTAHQLFEKLGPKSSFLREEHVWPLWNSWPIVTLFFSLVFGEWIARRRAGLL